MFWLAGCFSQSNALRCSLILLQDAVQEVDDTQIERHKKLDRVMVTEVSQSELTFYVQRYEHGGQLESYMAELRAELSTNPPVKGAYTPKKGDLCVAKFVDDLWYRAKVEKVGHRL